MGPLIILYSSQEYGIVDYRGHIVAKCSTNPHSLDMTMSSIVSAAYTTVDITENENVATVLDHHIKVDMTTTV